MKLSARNRLKGRIVEVRKGQTTAHVRLYVDGTMITASITNEAVDELRLANGQHAYAVIKASDVMIATDWAPGPGRRPATRAAGGHRLAQPICAAAFRHMAAGGGMG